MNWEPLEAGDPTTKCEWTSSNENIATVNQGMVTGVAEGECEITATCGELKATAKVTVISEEEMERKSVEFSTCILYSWNPQYAEQYIIKRDTLVTIRIGTVNCYLQYRPFYFLGSNIYLTDTEILGADYEISCLIPIFIIDEPETSENAKYNGYYIGSDYEIGAVGDEVGTEYFAEAGHINDFDAYAAFVDNYLVQGNEEYAQEHYADDYYYNLAGAIFLYHDYDYEAENPDRDGSSWTLGLVTGGIFSEDDDYNLYYANVAVRWFDDLLGLKVNDTEDDVVRPYEYVYTDMVYANAVLAENAPRKMAAKEAQTRLRKQYDMIRSQRGEIVTAKRIK